MKIYFLCFLFAVVVLVSCSINNSPPEVLSVSIKDGVYISDVENFDEILINFSVPMDLYITESGISIDGYYGKLRYEWKDNDKKCTLFLSNNLEKGNMYTLTISNSCESKEGINLKKSQKVRLFTYSGENELAVTETIPEDGAANIDSNISKIAVKFSLPVEESLLYDRIDISPEIKYYYNFSPDYKTLNILPVESLDKNIVYKVTLRQGFLSLSGKSLKEDYSFSFSTVYSTDSFELSSALMADKGLSPGDPHIEIATDYLSETGGVEKDMELMIIFNRDFYLTSLEDHLTIEPYIGYHLSKEDRYARVSFNEAMVSEGKYTLSIDRGFKNIYGVALKEDYRFSWIVDGDESRYLQAVNIYIKDPNEINDTLIYNDGNFFQNESMLFQNKIDHQEVQFVVEFSSPIKVYESLEKISLKFMFGNSEATSGVMVGYEWQSATNTLLVTFSLPVITSGEDAYYKFVIDGGDGGIIDVNDNTLKEDLEIYTIYKIE